MAGRFKILTDEHTSTAHIKALRNAGWSVVRVIEVLEQAAVDEEVLTYCSAQGYVWLTSDEAAQGKVWSWIGSGRTLPGVIIDVQRHRTTPGRLVRFLERLVAEDNPFGGVIRFLRPEDD